MRRLALAVVLAGTGATQAPAQDYESAARAYLEQEAAGWASDPVLVEAIKSQNAETADLSEDEIVALDDTWRAEVDSLETPTVDAVLGNSASDFLRARVEDSGGLISEAFVMDAVGLNVAASGLTSDYWQGDEEKFTETYPKGPGTVHLGELEFDESSQTYQIQASMPVIDPETNEAVGAITIGLDAEAL